MIRTYKEKDRLVTELNEERFDETSEELIAVLACFRQIAVRKLGGSGEEYMRNLLEMSFSMDGVYDDELKSVIG